MACQIAVIGDSSSSGIGMGCACYPARLFGLLTGEMDVSVHNSAVPGFTSADASRFFHAIARARPLDYVIIYLGNNEGAVGVRKGYYHALATRVTELLSKRPLGVQSSGRGRRRYCAHAGSRLDCRVHRGRTTASKRHRLVRHRAEARSAERPGQQMIAPSLFGAEARS